MINMLLVKIRFAFCSSKYGSSLVEYIRYLVGYNYLIVHFDWLLFCYNSVAGNSKPSFKRKMSKDIKSNLYYRRNKYWLSKWYIHVCFGSYDVSGLLSGGCLDMKDRLFEMSVSRKYWYKTYLFNFSCCQFWSSKYIFSKSSE